MAELILHPHTAEQIQSVVQHPAQAMAIIGPSGSGKKSISFELMEAILDVDDAAADPYIQHITSDDGKAIGIGAVRELERFLALKVPSARHYNRAVLIEEAHLLTHEAQNALLKTLEEPPDGTLLILTASHEHALLPTIRSRVQTLHIKQPDRTQLESHFGQQFSSADVKQSLAISSGLPGLMTAILRDEDHALLAATQKARQILQNGKYERLLMVDELAKNKQLTADTLFILQQMAHVSLRSATGDASIRWQRVLEASYSAAEALSLNANPKLQLTELMLKV